MKVKNSEDGGQGRQWLAGGRRKGSSGGNGGKPSVPGFPPSGRVPAVLRHAGRQAPNGSVSGFRGSQKDNGHPPNGGPGGSARRFRSPPRPARPTCPLARAARDRRARGEMRGPGRRRTSSPATARPPLLAGPSTLTPPPSPSRSQAPRADAVQRDKGNTGVSRQRDFIGAPGRPACAPRPRPRARPVPPYPRSTLHRGAGGRAAGSPASEAAAAAAAATPAGQRCPSPRRQALLQRPRGGREPRYSLPLEAVAAG